MTYSQRRLKVMHRWFRKSWYRAYIRTVRMLEDQLGYEIYAC